MKKAKFVRYDVLPSVWRREGPWDGTGWRKRASRKAEVAYRVLRRVGAWNDAGYPSFFLERRRSQFQTEGGSFSHLDMCIRDPNVFFFNCCSCLCFVVCVVSHLDVTFNLKPCWQVHPVRTRSRATCESSKCHRLPSAVVFHLGGGALA